MPAIAHRMRAVDDFHNVLHLELVILSVKGHCISCVFLFGEGLRFHCQNLGENRGCTFTVTASSGPRRGLTRHANNCFRAPTCFARSSRWCYSCRAEQHSQRPSSSASAVKAVRRSFYSLGLFTLRNYRRKTCTRASARARAHTPHTRTHARTHTHTHTHTLQAECLACS